MVGKNTSLFFFIFFTFIFSGLGQKFSVSVSPETPKTYETAHLVFSFINMNSSPIQMPQVDGMKVLNGPNVFENSYTVNGKTEGETKIVYAVMFTKVGKVDFPSMTVNEGGKKIKSNPLSISVTKGVNPFPSGYEGKEAVVVLKESKKEAYLGECVSIDLIIYAFTNNIEVNGVDLPTFNDGWVQDIKGRADDRLVEDRYNGKKYFRLNKAKIWLVPIKTGEVIYDAARVVFNVYTRLPENNQGYQEEMQMPFDLKTNKAMFTIKELPEEKKPESFVNAIGRYNTTVSIDKTQAKANEPIKVKYTISGSGNFPILDGPPLNLPDHFETFEPKVKNKFQVLQDGITGEKEFEYYIMPRKEGDYQLGPFAFSYFDVETKKYVEIRSDSFQVSIKGMIVDTTSGTVIVNKGIFTGEKVYKRSDPFFGHPLYYALLILPFLAGLGMIFFRKKIFFTKRDDTEKKMNKAEDHANKELVKVRSILDKGQAAEALTAMTLLFYQYISDKYKTTKNEITRANLQNWLPDPNTKIQVLKIMDQLDQFRFAPAAQSDVESLYNHLKNLIDEMGKKG